MKILFAEMETRSFTFRTFTVNQGEGINEKARFEIQANLRRALRWHCQQMGVQPDKLLAMVEEGQYDLRVLEAGVVYRDSWPLAPGGANEIAPGKEGKAE
jgi:hypothetical protein